METEESSHGKDNTGGSFTIPSVTSWKTLSGVGIVFALLLYGTVLVFMAFDRDSHSASDTIRPFVITMAPVWIVAILAARVVLKRG